jgi:hypothetical protein
MDENNRITITVCGDGGCGMRLTVGHGREEGRLIWAQERARLHYGW